MKNPKVTKEKRDKWVQVMQNVLMSSEESCDDGDTIIVHPLPWRSECVTRMFHGIDKYLLEKKSPQAKRQQVHRIEGVLSTRTAPDNSNGHIPGWALK